MLLMQCVILNLPFYGLEDAPLYDVALSAIRTALPQRCKMNAQVKVTVWYSMHLVINQPVDTNL